MTSEADDSTSSGAQQQARPGSSRRLPISAERWRRIVGLVEVALDLEKPLRGAYLEAVTRQDPELRRQVHRMLRQFDGFLEPPTPEPDGSGATSALDAERIGPYRLLKVLGRGGMGVVYLAERRDREFERQVAIKIINAGHDLPIVHQRFLSERQILARFDHPNIARLFEGGTTTDGRPYFVLEYIDGLPLDVHCEEQQLSLEARLQLFLDVCSAVGYAHQNLVVHRDLKPSNILVDREGKPKLLDFGIAKLLDPSAMPFAVEQTRTSMRPMTLAYAAPEQVAGARITTATDVYSLGVLLFRLLAGRLPYELSGQHSTEEILTLLRQDPPRPSQVLAATLEQGPAPLTWNGQDAGRIARSLRGDLDNIVRKAMRYEAEERYASVGKLADDLRRYQQGEPVTATRDTPLYSLRKFVGKYRWVVAATLLLVLTLAAFALSARRQAREIARERDKAEESARDAKLTRDFLAGMLQVADATSLKDNKVPLDALLDQGFARLESGEVANAAVRVELLQVLAESYQSLRDLRQAARARQKAAELAEQLGRPAAEIYQLHKLSADTFYMTSDIPGAITELEQARAFATPDGRSEIDSRLLELDLFLDRSDSFRRRANAMLSAMTDEPAEDLGWLSILAGYAHIRSHQGDWVRSDAIARYVRGRLGNRADEPRFNSVFGHTIATIQIAAINQRNFEVFLDELRQGLAKLEPSARPHAGTLLWKTHHLHYLVETEKLAEAETLSVEILSELDKLRALNPDDSRVHFLYGRAHLLRCEIDRRRHRPPNPTDLTAALSSLERLHRELGNFRIDLYYFRALLWSGRREEAKPLMKSLLDRGLRDRQFLEDAREAGFEPVAPPVEWDLDFPPWLVKKLGLLLETGATSH